MMAAVTATGVPNPAAPSKNAPKQQLQPPVVGDAGDTALQYLEEPRVGGELVHEDHVEHDPADGQQAEERAQQRRLAGHFRGHAVDEDRHRERDGEPGERGPVGLDVEEREAAQQHQDGQRRAERGQPGVVQRIVDLRPGHRGSPPGNSGLP
jgi:hypothetical protein